MSIFSNWFGNTILQVYLRNQTVYLALHTADPTVLADPGSEVAGNGYQRQAISWSAPGSKSTANDTQVEFPAMPDCTVTHYAVWDQVSGGNMLIAVERSSPVVVASNQKFVLPASDLAVTL